MRSIEVNDLQSHLTRTRAKIVRSLQHLLRQEGVGQWSLSVAVVDDARIRQLNRRFCGRDEVTDVLSFPLSDDAGGPLSGEIVVSAEQAVAVACGRGADPVGELLLYTVHGALHLLGYDDHSPADTERMRAREQEVLSALGYPDAFAAAGDA